MELTDYQIFQIHKIAIIRTLEIIRYGEAKTSIPDVETLEKYPPQSLHCLLQQP
jgi:uncharacterized protein with HEPN domain